MKIIVVSDFHEKLSEFFIKQGSFEITYSLNNISSNLDVLTKNIIRVDKFIMIVSNDEDFASEIRALLTLLANPSGLLRIEEIVFFYRSTLDSRRIEELINVVRDQIAGKASDDRSFIPPKIDVHKLKSLTYNVIYKDLMGKSSAAVINPKTTMKYRVERGDESSKAFESSADKITISPLTDKNMTGYKALQTILQKTEDPSSLTALEALIPEYEDLQLEAYHQLGYISNKWVLMTGDRLAGTTTHATALAVSAVKAGRRVFVFDFSKSGGAEETLKAAVADYHVLTAKEILNNSVAMSNAPICVYENKSKEVLRSMLPYMQSRPNIFDRDLILVVFDLEDLEDVLGSVNLKFCSVVLSTLMFPNAVNKVAGVELGDVRTLVWLNDNVASPLRAKKFTSDYVKTIFRGKSRNYRFMEPIMFEDFELDADFYLSVEGVL
ncbi:hypothetical protein AGMMS49975_15260 [Clostridia bacterium]|nr:hypothetical protein AGMMS49975_15260 [Clostridia bacterium]